MGKKYILCIFSLLSILLFISDVDAEEDTTCNYNSKAYLNKLASNVNVAYDFKYETDGTITFDISVYNIVEDLYISYKAENSNEEKIFANMTTDGTYTFNVKDIDNIINYTFVVRSLRFGCTHDIRTITLVKPKKNPYSDLDICKYEELEDYFYCQKWISQELSGNEKEIIAKIKEKKNSLKKNTTTRCIECEEENSLKKQKAEYQKRKMILIITISSGMFIDGIAIIVMIVRIRRYSI